MVAPPWRAVDPRRALPFAWEAFEPRLRPVDAGGPCLDARFDDAKLGFGTPLAGLRKLGGIAQADERSLGILARACDRGQELRFVAREV